MKHIYTARDYFKSLLLPTYSTYHADSLGFVSESFVGAGGPIDRGSFRDVILSVCTYRNAYLRLTLNEDMGCHNGVCSTMKNDVARKFGIAPERILMHSGKMRQAAPGRIQQSQAPVITEGMAVGHEKLNGYGTLGGYTINFQARTAHNIISNNHVLANSNQAQIGDGIYTREASPRHVASLSNFIRIQFGGVANHLDLAAATIDSDERAQYGEPGTNRLAQVGDRVSKSGSTTGYTEGIIEALDETVYVTYGDQVATFEDQMVISGLDGIPFSRPGDSGSFIYAADGNFVGLLFAGLGNETNANHAPAVMNQLRTWQIVR